MKYQLIFWDWNGTLLDDTETCVESMNAILNKRSMPKLDTEKYRSLFRFPVKDYYVDLGFDFKKEKFEELSVEFIQEYNNRSDKLKLHNSALKTLAYFKSLRIPQVIISAMEQKMLENLLNVFSIYKYFDDINGVNDIYASGKTHLAKEYLASNPVNAHEILFIGDTLHDAEVAHEIGCDVVLVSNGHNSFERLKLNGHKVIADLSDLKNVLG